MRHVGLIVEHRKFVHGELSHLFFFVLTQEIYQTAENFLDVHDEITLIKQFFSELLAIIDRVEGTYLITALI